MGKLITILSLVALAATAPAVADQHGMTVEEVIARHVEAKGGDAWQEVDSMRVTGDFTAFSEESPFTLHRARDRRYHIDHTLNGRRVVIGFDGETRWWINNWLDGAPQPMDNPVDVAALERDLDFATPFFDYEERGYEVELVADRDEIEGFPAIAIAVRRGDEQEETWFLDPDTYLELARESPGSDFGQPRTALTFFDDFREVDGLMLPHVVETQWYTRDRMMRVAEVELNVDVADALFELPPATGMEGFQEMAGEWSVKVESKQDPRQPEFTESSRQSLITASLNGGLVEERYTTARGTRAVRSFTYDRFRDHYVMTQINDRQTFLDIQTGRRDENDTLVVSNVDSGTSSENFGMTFHERSSISPVTDEGFTIHREISIDGGENWGLTQRLTYTRKDD